jgi:N-acetylglucosamine-6-sulfatase
LSKKGEGRQREKILNAYRSLEAVDEGVQKIFKTLEDTGKLDNTIVVYMGDHGYLYGEHRGVEKACGYEECLKVPYLIRGPGIKPGARDELVSNVDLAPTLMNLAGLSPPGEHKFNGLVLRPLLDGSGTIDRDGILLHGIGRDSKPWHGVRTERYTYIKGERTGEVEIYDLANDPFQLDNIASGPGGGALVNNMEGLYRTLRR